MIAKSGAWIELKKSLRSLDSDDGASSEEEGFKTPQVRRSNRESRAPVRSEGIDALRIVLVMWPMLGEDNSRSGSIKTTKDINMLTIEVNSLWQCA
ncbi:hypothetical protein Tco_0450333 [Tanacetum coccineum]